MKLLLHFFFINQKRKRLQQLVSAHVCETFCFMSKLSVCLLGHLLTSLTLSAEACEITILVRAYLVIIKGHVLILCLTSCHTPVLFFDSPVSHFHCLPPCSGSGSISEVGCCALVKTSTNDLMQSLQEQKETQSLIQVCLPLSAGGNCVPHTRLHKH